MKGKCPITAFRAPVISLVLVVICSSPSGALPSDGAAETELLTTADRIAAMAQEEEHQEGQPSGPPSDSQTSLEEEAAEDVALEIADPLEAWNRGMYHLNDRLYFWVLKPVTRAYMTVVPEDFRLVFNNVFNNLKAPVRFANNLLQLKIRNAGEELLRFVVNTTIGIGGIGDMAKGDLGIREHNEDFGQTLGFYGVGHGFYIVWPIIGPSSLRETVGFAGDRFLYPLSYISTSDLSFAGSMGIFGFEIVNKTSFRLGDYESLKESAVDPYVSIRDAFLQSRKKKIAE